MAFKEARPFLLTVLILMLPAGWIHPVCILPLAAIFAYILYFFRDPERQIPPDPNTIVSAADGRVISVEEHEERWHSGEKRLRIAVFLSVFDVHVNRSPVAGVIEHLHYGAGEFLDARHWQVAERNEFQNWLIRTERGPVLVRQLAGLIARRIVGWRSVGDAVAKGERLGMIRFGSRTDVYLPLECEPLVRPGDRVKGGETVIARWKHTPQNAGGAGESQ